MSNGAAPVCFHCPYWCNNSEYLINSMLGAGKSPGEIEVNVEMQRCDAYEVVQLSRQRVVMKDNPAYVDVNLRTPV